MCRMILLAIVIIVNLPTFTQAQAIQWPVAEGGNGHWYMAITTDGPISWNNALLEVDSIDEFDENGYLATLTSQAESDWVLSNLQMGDVWLGAIQAPGSTEPDGGWGWITGEPWSYTNWCSVEPANSGGNEDRITIVYSWPRCPGAWNDANQDNVCSGYIVEWPASAVDTQNSSLGGVKAMFR